MSSTDNYIKKLVNYRKREIEVLEALDLKCVSTVLNVLEKAREEGKRIFIFGNGGSAATASHYAGDFNKGVNESIVKGKAENLYDFECLNDNLPTLMAVANDISYEEIFRFQLKSKLHSGDVVIGISGSGNSLNVINAIDYANQHGGITIAIVGYSGGKIINMCDYCIHVNVDDMQMSEDIHMIIDHMMMWVLAN